MLFLFYLPETTYIEIKIAFVCDEHGTIRADMSFVFVCIFYCNPCICPPASSTCLYLYVNKHLYLDCPGERTPTCCY